MIREDILLQLEQEYAQRREEDRRAFELRRDEACAACPGLREKLEERHEAILSRVRDGFRSADNPKADMARRNAEILAILQNGGFPENWLQPVYVCAECRDEGYVYTPSRQMCGCMRRELNRRLLIESGIGENGPSFESWDETVYSDEAEGSMPSPRRVACLNRDIALRFADSFPDGKIRNLLLSGGSGLGKTYLLQCIACRTAERGFLPRYTSAYRFFEKARTAYMENREDAVSEFLQTPLLLLDDLGTEPLMNNITVTQLFNLLNERMLAGRCTVISTNLSVPELRERYTERITSRLLDESDCAFLPFRGEDVRRTRRKASK